MKIKRNQLWSNKSIYSHYIISYYSFQNKDDNSLALENEQMVFLESDFKSVN